MSGEKELLEVEKFFKVSGELDTSIGRLIKDCYTEIYKGLGMYFKDLLDTHSVKDFVRKAKEVTPEYNYFWNWLEREGLDVVEEVSKGVPDTVEFKDFLVYRKTILRMDKENKNLEMFFLSIKEFLELAGERLKGSKI